MNKSLLLGSEKNKINQFKMCKWENCNLKVRLKF